VNTIEQFCYNYGTLCPIVRPKYHLGDLRNLMCVLPLIARHWVPAFARRTFPRITLYLCERRLYLCPSSTIYSFYP